jgi:hypothetical protein
VHAALPALCTVALVLGCGDRPSAPVLQDEPVYNNAREGFRLLAPDGWVQSAKGDLPRGPLTKERLLVNYRMVAGDRMASLEVLAADLPETEDLAERLAGPSYGAMKWTPVGPPEKLEVGGVPATRFRYGVRIEGVDMSKEVVIRRRGERVYFFTGIYVSSDTASRDQIRRAVGSLIWTY